MIYSKLKQIDETLKEVISTIFKRWIINKLKFWERESKVNELDAKAWNFDCTENILSVN